MGKSLDYLGIARMSGNIELGEENAKALIKAGKARLLLLAGDASDGVKKRAEARFFSDIDPLRGLRDAFGAICSRGTRYVLRDTGGLYHIACAKSIYRICSANISRRAKRDISTKKARGRSPAPLRAFGKAHATVR